MQGVHAADQHVTALATEPGVSANDANQGIVATLARQGGAERGIGDQRFACVAAFEVVGLTTQDGHLDARAGQGVVYQRQQRVVPLAWLLDHNGSRGRDLVCVVARSTGQDVHPCVVGQEILPDPATQRIGPGATDNSVVARRTIQCIVSVRSSSRSSPPFRLSYCRRCRQRGSHSDPFCWKRG